MDQPRVRMSAFAIFLKKAWHLYKEDHPSRRINCGAFTRQCAVQWKALTERQKARFRGLAAKDKMRYENELRELQHPPFRLVVTPLHHLPLSLTSPVLRKKKRLRKRKEKGRPRGLLTAYSFFLRHCRAVRSKRDPSDFGEFSRKCAGKWHAMDKRERRVFHRLAVKDKVRYAREMEEFHERAEQRSPVPSD